MNYSRADYIFFALFLLVISCVISWNAEGGLLYSWRRIFRDIARDFNGSKAQLLWRSIMLTLRH